MQIRFSLKLYSFENREVGIENRDKNRLKNKEISIIEYEIYPYTNIRFVHQ